MIHNKTNDNQKSCAQLFVERIYIKSSILASTYLLNKKTKPKKIFKITCENFKSNHFVIKTKTFEIKSIQCALCASSFIFS